MPKPFGQVPLPKQRCPWERGKAALHFGAPPALLWSWEDGSILQTAGLKSWQGQNPLEGEKAGMGGNGKILVKGRTVYKPLSAPGIGVAAAVLTCLTALVGVKPASSPCPQTTSWGLHPQRGRDTRDAAGVAPGTRGGLQGGSQPRGRSACTFWRRVRSGLGKAGSGQHPPPTHGFPLVSHQKCSQSGGGVSCPPCRARNASWDEHLGKEVMM